MINIIQSPMSCTNRALRNRALYSLNVEAKMERADRQAGHEYLPMDIFIDTVTMKDHFQAVSLRTP